MSSFLRDPRWLEHECAVLSGAGEISESADLNREALACTLVAMPNHAAHSIEPLLTADLEESISLLARACTFDRADAVAAEKLFGPAPGLDQPPMAYAARAGAQLVGVASVSGAWIRVLAVDPRYRGRGVGAALLAACEDHVRASSASSVMQVLDQPGNYLAPGIDERNQATIGWLERRGFGCASARVNLLVDLVDNPKVSTARATELASALAMRGYRVRRAERGDHAVLAAIAAEFGGAWPFEVARALTLPEPGVHLAERDGELCAFAAHDGNNQGLGWFGPTGTWPVHRGQRLAEALLIASLVDVARFADRCEIAWVGPEGFYEKSCGIAGRRRFLPMRKALR